MISNRRSSQNQNITRRKLEEIMMSLSYKITTDEDIKFINDAYLDDDIDSKIFRLSNTKKYFEEIIVPYCRQHFKSIINTIHDQNERKRFKENFEPKNDKKTITFCQVVRFIGFIIIGIFTCLMLFCYVYGLIHSFC